MRHLIARVRRGQDGGGEILQAIGLVVLFAAVMAALVGGAPLMAGLLEGLFSLAIRTVGG